mmetsp:Transcript_34729/g.81082  ORF Transcript_34729/g.81082 Transcript_34729/m.81082 type:complete len:262 (+) Transcript_34729:212-997(+)
MSELPLMWSSQFVPAKLQLLMICSAKSWVKGPCIVSPTKRLNFSLSSSVRGALKTLSLISPLKPSSCMRASYLLFCSRMVMPPVSWPACGKTSKRSSSSSATWNGGDTTGLPTHSLNCFLTLSIRHSTLTTPSSFTTLFMRSCGKAATGLAADADAVAVGVGASNPSPGGGAIDSESVPTPEGRRRPGGGTRLNGNALGTLPAMSSTVGSDAGAGPGEGGPPTSVGASTGGGGGGACGGGGGVFGRIAAAMSAPSLRSLLW